MTAEGTREPASEAGSGILGGVSSSLADSLRTQPQPRAVQVLAMLAESGIVRSLPGRAGGTFVMFRTRAERAQIVDLGTRDSVVDALSAAAFGPS